MESDDFRVKEEDLVRPFKIKALGKQDFKEKLAYEKEKQRVEIDPIFQPLFRVLSGK